MNELKPRQLSTVLWAMGRMRSYPGIEIMETLVTRARTSLVEHDPQVCMLWYHMRQGQESNICDCTRFAFDK